MFARLLFEYQEDTMGVYRPQSFNSGEVILYWGAIGIAAKYLQVDIEDLTAVVLAHELAHGYTHLGLLSTKFIEL